jgi:hypothetical protein
MSINVFALKGRSRDAFDLFHRVTTDWLKTMPIKQFFQLNRCLVRESFGAKVERKSHSRGNRY